MAYDASHQYEAPRRAYMQPSSTPAGSGNMKQQHNGLPHEHDIQYGPGQQYLEPDTQVPLSNGQPQQGYQNHQHTPLNQHQRRHPPPRGRPPGQYNEQPFPAQARQHLDLPSQNGQYRQMSNDLPLAGNSRSIPYRDPRGGPNGGLSSGQGGAPHPSYQGGRGSSGGSGIRGRGIPPGHMQRPAQNRPATSEGRGYAGPVPEDGHLEETHKTHLDQRGRGQRPDPNANFHRQRAPFIIQSHTGLAPGTRQDYQYSEQGDLDHEHDGRQGLIRSTTMPNAHSNYSSTNNSSRQVHPSSQHNQTRPAPARQNTFTYDDGYYGDFKAAELGRESIGDVLDMYSHPQEDRMYHLDDRSNSLTNNFHSQPAAQSAYGNVHPPHIQNGSEFSVQAHRSKSQPNIRDAYTLPLHDDYAPPMPRSNTNYTNYVPDGTGYNGEVPKSALSGQFVGGSNAQYGGRPVQPGHAQPANHNQPSMSYQQVGPENKPPPRSSTSNSSTNRPVPHSAQLGPRNTQNSSISNALSANISTMSLNSNVDPNGRTSLDPDALPAHPAPIRPGLLPNATLSQRPYSPSITSNRSDEANRARLSGPLTLPGLEKLRGEAHNSPLDQALQLHLAKKLIEASSNLADDGGRLDAKSAKRNRDNYVMEAHKVLKKLVSGTHQYPEAMFFMATCYGDGSLGFEVDHEKAFNLYQSGAKLNHPPSAYRTAVCCEIGAGTRKEPLKAMQWYKKAATLGDTAAMYKTGMILYKGLLGQPKSVREAISWLKRAADQADEDNPHALHQLGLLYETAESNDTIIRDLSYAKELFQKAAELGYIPSQFKLGNSYAYGTICPVDAKLSITWFSRAAAKGDPESELALSGWYLTGADGILEQSDTEAYLWARKSAEKGLAKAEYGVGHFTELGIGLGGIGNEEEAKKWYFRAAGQGHPKAQARLQELQKGGGKKKQRERLSRSNKAKDDADCVVM